MSKLACRCGGVISDITEFLPYKAHFLPSEDIDTALDAVKEEVAQFIEARERGEQELFSTQRTIFPRNRTLREMVFQLFTHPTFEFGRPMYECETCGRIWMRAVPDSDEWVSYQPESARRGILRHQGATPDA